MANPAAPQVDESQHDTENCPGGPDCPYSCPTRPELAAWTLDEDVDGNPHWWRPGTEHDALTLHHEDDASEFGIVSASSAAEALRIDRETFGGSAATPEARLRGKLVRIEWLSADNAADPFLSFQTLADARVCPVFRTITGAA